MTATTPKEERTRMVARILRGALAHVKGRSPLPRPPERLVEGLDHMARDDIRGHSVDLVFAEFSDSPTMIYHRVGRRHGDLSLAAVCRERDLDGDRVRLG